MQTWDHSMRHGMRHDTAGTSFWCPHLLAFWRRVTFDGGTVRHEVWYFGRGYNYSKKKGHLFCKKIITKWCQKPKLDVFSWFSPLPRFPPHLLVPPPQPPPASHPVFYTWNKFLDSSGSEPGDTCGDLASQHSEPLCQQVSWSFHKCYIPYCCHLLNKLLYCTVLYCIVV